MHLPAIDAIQLLLRSRSLIKRKANPQPPPTNGHVIHGNLLSRIAKIIGAPWVGISPGSISTHQIMASPPPSPRFAKISVQKFAVAARCRHPSHDRLSPKSRKRHFEQETCTHHLDKDIYLIGMYLGSKAHSEQLSHRDHRTRQYHTTRVDYAQNCGIKSLPARNPLLEPTYFLKRSSSWRTINAKAS